MAGPNLNKVFLIGRLTKDPELRYTSTGQAVSSTRIAVNREYISKEEKKEDTLFINLVVWGKRAEVWAEYLKKGSLIFVEGHLKSSQWETPDNEKRYRVEVIVEDFQFLDKPHGGTEDAKEPMEEETKNIGDGGEAEE
ncbi:MAG: single-stranded DNA-binding protein [Elusimicrobia bacterium]|jgi:single-strand DNA-binding protein|nr:single-stranded DNA-binding protein [Elusimicrobiota bacterium]